MGDREKREKELEIKREVERGCDDSEDVSDVCVYVHEPDSESK